MADQKTYKRICSSCGEETIYSRIKSFKKAEKFKRVCRRCAQKRAKKKLMHKEVPIRWFNKKRLKAAERGIKWSITPMYLQTIYERQKGMCALSGVPISFDMKDNKGVASIDRIDSDKGYQYGNIQLVEKTVNFMKWSLTQEGFIAMCKKVVNLHRKNSKRSERE